MRTGVSVWYRARRLFSEAPHGSASEEETPADGRIRICLRFDIEEEALQFALSFGPNLEIVEPLGLRAKVGSSAEVIRHRALPAWAP